MTDTTKASITPVSWRVECTGCGTVHTTAHRATLVRCRCGAVFVLPEPAAIVVESTGRLGGEQ